MRRYEDIMDFLDRKIDEGIDKIVNNTEEWIQDALEPSAGRQDSLDEYRAVKNELDMFKATRDKLREYAEENTKVTASAMDLSMDAPYTIPKYAKPEEVKGPPNYMSGNMEKFLSKYGSDKDGLS